MDLPTVLYIYYIHTFVHTYEIHVYVRFVLGQLHVNVYSLPPPVPVALSNDKSCVHVSKCASWYKENATTASC